MIGKKKCLHNSTMKLTFSEMFDTCRQFLFTLSQKQHVIEIVSLIYNWNEIYSLNITNLISTSNQQWIWQMCTILTFCILCVIYIWIHDYICTFVSVVLEVFMCIMNMPTPRWFFAQLKPFHYSCTELSCISDLSLPIGMLR